MFTVKEISNDEIKNELINIGFDHSYINQATDKFRFKLIKIFALTSVQANILKQTALSQGTDCAVNKNVITGSSELSDAILCGTIAQLKKISERLKSQQFSLDKLSEKITEQLNQIKTKTKIVGILNLSEDSFSDDGIKDTETAVIKIRELFNDGADIIDIGAESTKPYSTPIPPELQLKKLLPLLELIKNDKNLNNNIYSIDTRYAEIAEECIKTLTPKNIIINDVSGFDYDNKMIDVIAKYQVPIILQHSKGTPQNMQDNPKYDNVIEEIFFNLKSKINLAYSKGISEIIIDPGIGFGKTKEHNLQIIRKIKEFRPLNHPIMLGVSRKSFLNANDNHEKDMFTLAFNYSAFENNVDYIRVHNVKIHKKLSEFFN